MKKETTGLVLSLLFASTLVLAEEKLTVDMPEALKNSQTNGILALREGYHGELVPVFSWGVSAKLKDEHPRELIEFTHLNFGDRGIGKRLDLGTCIVAGIADAKTGELKQYGSPAVFIPNLPGIKILKTYRTIEQFEDVFGVFRGLTDGWGSPTESHSSLYWRAFALAQSNTIRVVSVFLHTVSNKQTVKQKPNWRIEGISIREGVFETTGHEPKMRTYK